MQLLSSVYNSQFIRYVTSITPLWHLLTNSSPVPSYSSHHPWKLDHTHANFITLMPVLSCSHNHWPTPTLGHSQALTLFLLCNINLHTFCNLPTDIFHLNISSSHILLCSNSEPVHTYYVITCHIHHHHISIIADLASHFHQYCCDSFLV